MRLLVTGSAGFIGSNFVRYWLEQHPGDHVVGLDLLTYAGDPRNLDGLDVRLVEGDIGDLELVERLLAEEELEVVVNFAAESHNSLAVLDPSRFFRTNALGTQTLLEAARRHGLSRFHHVSTCEVYGDLPLDSSESFSEESPYRPRTPYNASKAAADHAVRAYHETYGLPVTITNCSNNYGPRQFPEKLIPLFLTNALDDRELPLYASTGNRREWLHVDDHCRAIELVLERGPVGQTYNVGSGVERSIMEIADLVLELTGKPQSLKTVVPDRPGHDRRYLLDSSKLGRELGWRPEISFEDGLRATVEWYAANRAWWEPLRERAPVRETGVDLSRGVLVTGAGGQLGAALCEEFGDARILALTRADWDVALPPPADLPLVDVALHAAAWTDVDGAETEPQEAAAVNVGGTQHVAELGAPLVLFSTDYVFDGRKREPYLESDAPNPLSVYGRTKLEAEAVAGDGAWIVRTSWLFGSTGSNFVRTMLRLGAAREEVAVVDDQRGCPTYVGHLAAAVRELLERPRGVWHLAADGDCTWAEFAEAIFEEAGLDCRVRRISTAELGRPAARPAYSVLRSERPNAPRLPHWRNGLRECLERLGV